MNTAIESICPRGWSLPSRKRAEGNRSITDFNPVVGGYYVNGNLIQESERGFWWGSDAFSSAGRSTLVYDGSRLYNNDDRRYGGFYIRCVSEEKTVTDLTYMQDMTPQIAPALSLCI